MLRAFTLILVFQLLGELAARAAQLSIPGPVLGMLAMFVFLLLRGAVPEDLARTADLLLAHLSLLFVPAGVGIMLHFRLIGDDWMPLALALVASTLTTIAVTALVMARFRGRLREHD